MKIMNGENRPRDTERNKSCSEKIDPQAEKIAQVR